MFRQLQPESSGIITSARRQSSAAHRFAMGPPVPLTGSCAADVSDEHMGSASSGDVADAHEAAGSGTAVQFAGALLQRHTALTSKAHCGCARYAHMVTHRNLYS